MRNRILTKRERELLDLFLNDKKTTESFRMLKLRIKRSHNVLTADMELINRAIEKFDKSA